MSAFRICIFSSAWTPAHHIQHLLRRISTDLPETEVAGILYETDPLPLSRRKRIKRVKKYLSEPLYIRYLAHNILAWLSGELGKMPRRLLHLTHRTDGSPNSAYSTLTELVHECEAHGIAFMVTKDVHNDASLEFVKGLRADIGVTFGARILKPKLFSIPRLGSINSHQHKLPDYRGSGAPGLWEIRDGRTEVTVMAHRLNAEVDAGPVLDERSFPIEPFDTLTSLALKANLVGVDGLIDVIRAEANGKSVEVPQPAEGITFKGIPPHRMWAMEEGVRKQRKQFRPATRRPFYKRAAQMLTYPRLYFRNRRLAREKNFPIVILSYQMITDQVKHMGLPTDYFLRHVHFLKEYYRIVSLPDALEMLKKGEVNAPTVVLTLDDEYADHSLGQRAVIEPENIPVTFLVCPRDIPRRSEFQHDIDCGEHGLIALGQDEICCFDKHGTGILTHARINVECGSTDAKKPLDEIVFIKWCRPPQSLWELELLLQSIS